MQHLQKTEGWGCSSHSGTHPPLGVHLSFQSLTHCPFCNPFVFTFMRVMGGVHPGGSILPKRHWHEPEESRPSASSHRYFLNSLLHYFLLPLQSLPFLPGEKW